MDTQTIVQTSPALESPQHPKQPVVLPPALSEVLFRYEEYRRSQVSRNSVGRDGDIIHPFLMRFHERCVPSAILSADLETYKAERLADGVSANKVRLESAAIQRFFNWRNNSANSDWRASEPAHWMKGITRHSSEKVEGAATPCLN